jgi:hypothetical protein
MKSRRLWIAAAAGLIGVVGAAPAHAVATRPVAAWEMDDIPRDRIMDDHTGNGLAGKIGQEVQAVTVDGARAYRFAKLQPDTPPTHPQHLVVVPNSPALDPGDGDFAVSLRLRTTYQFGNIIQKGQATVPGGSWKLQIPNGLVQCWFRGTSTAIMVTAPRKINDGRWHDIQCDRTDDGVFLTIDGETVAGKYGWTGSIANTWPLTIGGKSACDQIAVGCDYFAGDIDYVVVGR